jgi:hypothetical protein
LAKRGLVQIPLGPLSISVPGCVDGWFELNKIWPNDYATAIAIPFNMRNGFRWQMKLQSYGMNPFIAEQIS